MLVEAGNDCRFVITPEGKENLRDIAISVILASYQLAAPFGLGHQRNHARQLTVEDADLMLRGVDVSGDYISNPHSANKVSMDYVFGRCCKTTVNLKDDSVEVFISKIDRKPKSVLRKARSILKAMSKVPVKKVEANEEKGDEGQGDRSKV